jgi:hypothetical protein
MHTALKIAGATVKVAVIAVAALKVYACGVLIKNADEIAAATNK